MCNVLNKQINREDGFSLPELLISMAIFLGVAVGLIMIIQSISQSSSHFQKTATTQASFANASANIQKNISSATQVNYASQNAVWLTSKTTTQTRQVVYYAYSPGTSIPAGLSTPLHGLQSPSYSAIVMAVKNGDSSWATSVLSSYTPSDTNALFSYFDKDNTAISAPTIESMSSSDLAKIDRIQHWLTTTIPGRVLPYELVSSTEINQNQVSSTGSNPDCSLSNIHLSVIKSDNGTSLDNNARGALLTWNVPSCASSYQIYRKSNQTDETTYTTRSAISDPNTTTLWDRSSAANGSDTTGLKWGTTYCYYIDAIDLNGNRISTSTSPQCVVIRPQSTAIVNVNPAAALTDVRSKTSGDSISYGTKTGITGSYTTSTTNADIGNHYTVARDTTNQVAYLTRFGATSYKIVETNASTGSVIQTVETTNLYKTFSEAYDNSRTYTVYAINAGGTSDASGSQTLISAPSAPDASHNSRSVSCTDSSTVSKYASGCGIKFTFTKKSPVATNYVVNFDSKAAATCSVTTSSTTWLNTTWGSATSVTKGKDTNWGTANCVGIRNYNTAGYSPMVTDSTYLPVAPQPASRIDLSYGKAASDLGYHSRLSDKFTLDRNHSYTNGVSMNSSMSLTYNLDISRPSGGASQALVQKSWTKLDNKDVVDSVQNDLDDADKYADDGKEDNNDNSGTDDSALVEDPSETSHSSSLAAKVSLAFSLSAAHKKIVSTTTKDTDPDADIQPVSYSTTLTWNKQVPGVYYTFLTTIPSLAGVNRSVVSYMMTRPTTDARIDNLIESKSGAGYRGMFIWQSGVRIGYSSYLCASIQWGGVPSSMAHCAYNGNKSGNDIVALATKGKKAYNEDSASYAGHYVTKLIWNPDTSDSKLVTWSDDRSYKGFTGYSSDGVGSYGSGSSWTFYKESMNVNQGDHHPCVQADYYDVDGDFHDSPTCKVKYSSSYKSLRMPSLVSGNYSDSITGTEGF